MKHVFLPIFALLTLISACNHGPQPINVNSDNCDYCRMMISDKEFASQVLNKQGRSFKFDSVECMAAYDLSNEGDDVVNSRWVPNFLNTDEWLEATSAFYLHSETLRSPMGMYLSAYSNRADAERMQAEYGGRVIGYQAVLDLVRAEWLEKGGHQMHGHH
jgi:copper chaperone NosL